MLEKEIRGQITSIVRSVLAQQELGIGIPDYELHDDTNLLMDLSMDSMEVITVIAKIESAFNIEFDYSDMDIDNITIFGNIVRNLKKVLSASGR